MFAASAANAGVDKKPMLTRSLAELPLASRGSLIPSASHLPPFGLKISIS